MPQYRKKRYAVKRRPSRKAPRRSPQVTIQSLLQGAAVGYLKRKLGLNTEEKFIDANGTTTATSTLVQRIAMPAIPQGVGDNERVGSNLRITRVETRIIISAAAAATTGGVVRIIQVRHKEAVAPTAAEILEVTTEASSPYNKKQKELGITVLKDIFVPIGTVTGGNSVAAVEWTHSGTNDQVSFATADVTGVNTNVYTGVISTWWMMDSNFSTAPVFASTSRYYWVDN